MYQTQSEIAQSKLPGEFYIHTGDVTKEGDVAAMFALVTICVYVYTCVYACMHVCSI